ncbi:MAG: hypothetical protein U0V54_05880 [Saprospiraceae bacterium]
MECEEGTTTPPKNLPCPWYVITSLTIPVTKINLLNTCGSNNQFVQLYYSFTGDGSDLVLNVVLILVPFLGSG